MLPWRQHGFKTIPFLIAPSSHAHLHFHRTPSLNSSIKHQYQIQVPSLLINIKHLTKNGFFDDALHLYRLLRSSTTNPANLPFVYALKACGALPAVHEGLSIHCLITKAGLHQNLTLMNSLIEVYYNFSHLDAARKVFDAMPQRNTVSWNLMMLGYAACGQPLAALEFCGSMKKNRIALDAVGLKIVLPICGQVEALGFGQSIHGHLVVSGASSDTALATAVMDMYARCGELGAAEKAFDDIVCKDVVSWNAMIAGYSRALKFKNVIELLHRMLAQCFKPSIPTILLSLKASTHLSVLQVGKAIHGYIISNGFYVDVSIKGLLIDMYSKCGELGSACGVFMEITRGKVNSWSCMINGLGIHGYVKESLMLFFAMLKHGVEPDDVCFLLLLSSCSHWRMAEEGWKVFYHMVSQFGVQPTKEHWASMVDLIGRAGCIKEALRFVNEMPLEHDSSMLGAFLGACGIHGDQVMGKELGDWLIEAGCAVPGFYKLLVGINAGKEQWDEVVKIREVIEERRLRGYSGSSLVEVSLRGSRPLGQWLPQI